jgi:NitT/TauT family transport system ATP-binding protein
MSETENEREHEHEPERSSSDRGETDGAATGVDVAFDDENRATGTGLVQVEDLSKVYDPEGADVTAVKDLDLHIEDNEFVCVLGPSGCGKSTLLECIAGYLEPTTGSVRVDGEEVSEPDPSRGVVFQENRLFPWKTIGENIRFGPQMRDDAAVDDRRVGELLDKTGLEQFEEAYPNELSGGMQQRAELSRLLANDPEIMLMDEPFSGLDAMTKELMQELLLEIWDDENRTVMFITHDVEEAIFLADRVVVMTARPGQVKGVIDVELDRPRDFEVLTTDRFTEYKDRALELIHEEAERAMEQADQGA